MQIVIDIDEKDYNFIQEVDESNYSVTTNLYKAVYEGIILPKGHGRLIDADRLKTHFVGTEQGTDLEVYLEPTIINAPTVIEAESEDKE